MPPVTGKSKLLSRRGGVSSKSRAIGKSSSGGDKGLQKPVDNPSGHPTGDAMRDRIRELFGKALGRDADDSSTPDQRLAVAIDIERAMHSDLRCGTDEYKEKFRTLNFNLNDKKNVTLRSRLIAGEITAQMLVEMSSTELANEEERELKKALSAKAAFDVTAAKEVATTAEFKCGKCKKRECTYHEMQTRSADEPMTVFVRCTNCGHRWRQ